MPTRAFACLTLSAVALLAGCKPPAADEYADRAQIGGAVRGPSQPIGSPDVEGALWAPAARADRIIYGKPGEAPLMALECRKTGALTEIGFSRIARADDGAQGILALIGNGHVERLFVDAAKGESGAAIWAGSLPASDPRLEVLTGGRQVEATVPGAGSVILHPSALPAELIARCRAMAPPPAETALPDAPQAPPAGQR